MGTHDHRSWQHRFEPKQHEVMGATMGLTIADWLRRQRCTYYRPLDLDRLFVANIRDDLCGDPDRDFALNPSRAAHIAQANIDRLHAALTAERRRNITNRADHDVSRHAQLVRALCAEMLTQVWIERAIVLRAGVPATRPMEVAHG